MTVNRLPPRHRNNLHRRDGIGGHRGVVVPVMRPRHHRGKQARSLLDRFLAIRHYTDIRDAWRCAISVDKQRIYLRISDDREGRALGVKRQEEDFRTLAE
jgi:hypothetical protein